MINKDIIYSLSWILFLWANKLIFSSLINLDPTGEAVSSFIGLQAIFYLLYIVWLCAQGEKRNFFIKFLGWPHLLIHLTLEAINQTIEDLIPEKDNLDELLRLYIIKSLREQGYVDFDLFKLAYAPRHYKKINNLFKVYRKELNLTPIYENGLVIYRRDSKFID
jgi:hypothetical protein